VIQLRRIGVIVDIDDDRLPFLEPQQRSRNERDGGTPSAERLRRVSAPL